MLSVLSPVETKSIHALTSESTPAAVVTTTELLTAKAPIPLSNAQEEKKHLPELPPYAAQPPPMPTNTGRGRGGRSRGRGRGNQSTPDLQHQPYMSNMPPYSGFSGFPGQQMPAMGPGGMQAFQPNPMMQPGAGMMPQMNPAQFPTGQFPPGGQFPPMQ